MSTITVSIPQLRSAESISRFAGELHSLPDVEEYVVDFGPVRFMSPFAMLLLATHLRQFREARNTARCEAKNFADHTYAAHMGLFKAFGLDHGNAPGQAGGSSTYLPITSIDGKQITEEAQSRGVNPGQVVEERADGLARILTRYQSGDVLETLTYSIREILRNVIEHSEAETAMVCAQYWPTKHAVEVGIADRGRGIRAGLADNDRFEYQTDREAVQVALLPGVSGNIAAGRGGDDHWQNSGYGLYMTSRICRHAGSFSIYSGDAGVKLGATTKVDIPSSLRGTAIQMVVDTRLITGLTTRLAQFRQEGRRAAKQMIGTVQLEASTASQMLSKDFRD